MKPESLMTGVTLAAIALMALGGCVTNSSPGFEAGESPRSIEDGVATTMAALYDSAPGSKELAAKAEGILVFPRVVDGIWSPTRRPSRRPRRDFHSQLTRKRPSRVAGKPRSRQSRRRTRPSSRVRRREQFHALRLSEGRKGWRRQV